MDSRTDRRTFLAALGSAPLVPQLAPGAVDGPDSQTARPEVTVETIKEAEKLLGITFDDEERKQLARALRDQASGLAPLRAKPIPNGLGPAWIFSPRPKTPPLLAAGAQGPRLPAGVPELPARPRDVAFLPVHALSRLIRARRLSSVQLTKLCLERLREHHEKLFCVVNITEELALAQAAKADEELGAGRWRGPLHGIPYGLKDLFAVKGYPTTWGAAPFKDRVIDEDAAVYERLRDAGAVLCAKLTLGALAMGDRWFGGRTRSPWNTEKGSSGSSAGSASAVAAGLLPFALGTETLGSIVSPCTRCGTTGLRPSFGRVSRHGAMALCWTLDKAGPITRSVLDAALVFDAIRGKDPRDPSSYEAPFRFESGSSLKGYRIGYVAASFEGGRGAADRDVLDVLRGLGATPVPVELPSFSAAPLRPLLSVEAAAAFDEITRDGRVRELTRQGRGSWPRSFRKARFYPAVEFVQASRLRAQLLVLWNELMDDLDVLVAPTFRGGTLLPTNFTGHPAVVLPHAFSNGEPRSITFVGGLTGEGPLLEVAHAYQEATQWHLERPKGF